MAQQMEVERAINMTITFIKQNKTFDLRTGFVIERNYNEDLDSAEVYIDHTTDVILDWCKILDVVYIYNDIKDETYYFVVSSIDESQVSFVEPFVYQYHLSLVSQTKELEGVILPNLKITQLKDETARAERTIKYYMEQYLNEYGAKVYKKYSATSTTIVANKWSINYLDKFDKECPEMQWNNPTFREVITDLAMIVDCIPYMSNNVIDFIDLTYVGSKCATDGINQSQRSLSLDDSASELRCELKNVMQSNVDNVNDTIEATEYIGFRTDDYLMTTENFKIILSNPILELISVKMSGVIIVKHDNYSTYDYIKDVDITSLIKEYTEWATLPIWGSVSVPSIEPGKYQEITPYFKRYGNVIENFDDTNKIKVLWTDNPYNCLSYILSDTLTKIFGSIADYHPTEIYKKTLSNIKNIAFKITYRTTASALFQASKNDNVNSRVVVDNQTSSFVDPYAQGLLEYAKVNRLGNKIRVVQSRWKYSLIRGRFHPAIGLRYGDDEIIFKTRTSYYDDCMLIDFYTTPNYVLRNYFTGVQAKLRNWKIVDGNDALERHDLIKIYAELSSKADTVARDVEHQMDKLSVAYNLLYGLFVDTEAKPIRYCFLNINEKADTLFLVDLTSRLVGKSMLFTFGFNDNYEVGKAIKDETVEGGIGMNPLSYVDSNGENTGGHFWLTSEYSISSNNEQYLNVDNWHGLSPNSTQKYNKSVIAFQDESNHKPIANDDNLDESKAFAYITFDLHKDNSEITRLTTQFEFLDNLEEEIYIGSQFVKRMKQIRTNTINLSYKAYYTSTKPNANNIDNAYLSSKTSVQVNSIELVDSNCFRVIYNSTIASDLYVYVYDENDNVLFVYKNTSETSSKYLYLNLFEIRDKTIYN